MFAHGVDPPVTLWVVAVPSCKWPQTLPPPVSLTPPAWLLESVTPVLPSVEASRVELALLADPARTSEAFMEHLLCTGCTHRRPLWHGHLTEHIRSAP